MPFPKNQVMKRSGRARPSAKAVPCELSMISSVGRPTVAMAPPTRPRSIVRRLKGRPAMIDLLFRLAHEAEGGACHQVDHQVLKAISRFLEGPLEDGDGGLFSLRLVVPE